MSAPSSTSEIAPPKRWTSVAIVRGTAPSRLPMMRLNVTVSSLAQSRNRRLPVPLDDKVVAAEQQLAVLFATADQIPEAPDFAKWVDRRFNSVLPVSST